MYAFCSSFDPLVHSVRLQRSCYRAEGEQQEVCTVWIAGIASLERPPEAFMILRNMLHLYVRVEFVDLGYQSVRIFVLIVEVLELRYRVSS